MKVLIVYFIWCEGDTRSSLNDNLYSFRRYSDEECYYLNAANGIPRYIDRINFDLVVYHYTFLDRLKWTLVGWRKVAAHLKELKCYKVAIPNDEQLFSDRLNDIFSELGVKTVFTAAPQSEWRKVYPQGKSGVEHFFTVPTGFIDEIAVERIAKSNVDHRSRTIDIGYRARDNSYALGRHGMIKSQLTEKFLNAPIKHNLRLDLSNDSRDAFLGDEWYEFLGQCRVVLGCESGSSLHDSDRSIWDKTERYVYRHPEASFEEVEAACFPGMDGNIRYFALSPRHFEAAITRSCQALVEGEYGGVFKPGVHYIEIKKDWSNIPEVIGQIEDVDYCERLADNAYRDIVQSGLYTYRRFVQQVLEHARSVRQPVLSSGDDARYLRRLELHERYPFVFSPVTFSVNHIIYTVYKVVLRLNMYTTYFQLRYMLERITRRA